MSNSSYCRFENTRADLRACAEHLHDNLSDDEDYERERLIKLCQNILTDWAAHGEQRKIAAALTADDND